MKTLASSIAEPTRIELLQDNPPKQANADISLSSLEQELTGLEVAFGELERLRTIEAEAQKAFEQACEEEKQCLSNGELSEKDAIRRLVEVRAKKDLRNQRLLDAGRKVELQIDLIVYDVAEPLCSKFANFANSLLVSKENEIKKLLAELFPPGHGLRLSIDELVRASSPVTQVRQVCNFVRNELATDQNEHLEQLRTLPAKWIRALYELA